MVRSLHWGHASILVNDTFPPHSKTDENKKKYNDQYEKNMLLTLPKGNF